MELADMQDLGSCVARRRGSSPLIRILEFILVMISEFIEIFKIIEIIAMIVAFQHSVRNRLWRLHARVQIRYASCTPSGFQRIPHEKQAFLVGFSETQRVLNSHHHFCCLVKRVVVVGPVNIYALTRISDSERIERLERQMSGRDSFLKVKKWEIEGLKYFSEHLCHAMEHAADLEFYYSFTLPKLGKEFDLIRVNDEFILNVEIKSGNISDEAIQKQLLQNRYYLASIGRDAYFFTFVSNTGVLLRLSNAGRLVEASWEELAALLQKQDNCYQGAIEDLFREDQYLLSPLTDAGRFLRGEYFLTSQQREIKQRILRKIQNNVRKKIKDAVKNESNFDINIQGFSGLPGTGKSMLLFDLAIELSRYESVCVFYFGKYTNELEEIDRRLKRVDFYYCSVSNDIKPSKAYAAILVDEGHRMDAHTWEMIQNAARDWNSPVIISYDVEECIAPEERQSSIVDIFESMAGFVKYRLTNRIRLNSELSSFIQCIVHMKRRCFRKEYPHVSLMYASNLDEANVLLKVFGGKGYVYIWDLYKEPALSAEADNGVLGAMAVPAASACREYDRVVMMADESFYYDEDGFLRSSACGQAGSRVRNLFHGLNRARKGIALIVIKNTILFDRLMGVLQRY